MQKAQSIYKFYPEWVRAGTRPGLRCTKEIAHGFSWGRNCAAQNPQPLCPAGQAVPQAQHTGRRNPRWPVLAGNDYGLPVFAETGGMGPFVNI